MAAQSSATEAIEVLNSLSISVESAAHSRDVDAIGSLVGEVQGALDALKRHHQNSAGQRQTDVLNGRPG
jgi:hypothetical protein